MSRIIAASATAAASGGTCMRRSSNSLSLSLSAPPPPWQRQRRPRAPMASCGRALSSIPAGIAAPRFLLRRGPPRSVSLLHKGAFQLNRVRGNRGGERSLREREREERSGGRGDQLRSAAGCRCRGRTSAPRATTPRSSATSAGNVSSLPPPTSFLFLVFIYVCII